MQPFGDGAEDFRVEHFARGFGFARSLYNDLLYALVVRVLGDVGIVLSSHLEMGDHHRLHHALHRLDRAPRRRREREDSERRTSTPQLLHDPDVSVIASSPVGLVDDHAHKAGRIASVAGCEVVVKRLGSAEEHATTLPVARAAVWANRALEVRGVSLWNAHDLVARLDLLRDERPRGSHEDHLARGKPPVIVEHHHCRDEGLAQACREADQRVAE